VIDLLLLRLRRAVLFVFGEEPADEVESPGTGIPEEELSTTLAASNEEGSPIDLSRWTVTEYVESPFEKVGRLYLEGDDLVIRSDLDPGGFRVPLVDVVAVLDGDPHPIRLLGSNEEVGVARLSASGKAVNFSIAPFLYTTPLRDVVRVLEERARKAALFVGREVVGG